MILYGDVFDNIVRAMRAGDNTVEQERIHRRLNQDAQAIARRDSWAMLRQTLDITWDDTAVQLPSDLIGIDMVWDDTNKVEYLPRNRAAAGREEPTLRYYTYPADTPLVSITDARLVPDSATMISDALEASGETVVGEYMQIEGDWQIYKITAASTNQFTISPTYKGRAEASYVQAIVRPVQTQMLMLAAPTGVLIESTTVTLHYWKQPDTMRKPTDIIPFPTADVLEFRSLARLPETKTLRPVTQTQVDAAFAEAAGLNPDKPGPRYLTDTMGRRQTQSPNHYMSRGGIPRVEGVYETWRRNRLT